MDDARTHSPHSALRTALVLALCLLIGGAVAAAFALRFAPRALARYEARAGGRIERDWDAGAARDRLLAEFARDAHGAEAMTGARRALRASLGADVPPGPLPPLTPGGAIAARLRGAGLVLRGLAAGSPAAARGGNPAAAPVATAEDVAVSAAAAAGDVAALDAALAAEFASWSRTLAGRAADLDPADRPLLWSDWRDRLEARAAEFEFQAAAREAAEPAAVRAGIAPHAALHALTMESRIPDPSAALLAFPPEPDAVEIRPLRSFWLGAAAAGALLGLALFAATRRWSRGPRAPSPLAAPAADPGAGHEWLHVVTGARRDRIGRAVCELTAHALAQRRRIVVVDASRRSRVHEALALSPRLGFLECASQGLPALGLLQSGGFTGLFLLARGRRGRLGDWLSLDRVLEELRPHFDRVVVVFDPDLPPVVGGVLAGRVMRGWWAGPGPATGGAARRAGDRLAIALADMELSPVPQASLEALEARLVALSGVVSLPPGPPATADGIQPQFRVSPPAVLDSDLQIRQKLRFLAWMRRMHTERESTPTSGRS